MGSNMQRQAVPLMKTESAIVATGIEGAIARDSGVMVRAKNAGVAVGVASDCIKIQEENGLITEYPLKKFARSNQGTCLNQRPIVNTGDRVEAGEIIADGPATNNGELGRLQLRGRNPHFRKISSGRRIYVYPYRRARNRSEGYQARRRRNYEGHSQRIRGRP